MGQSDRLFDCNGARASDICFTVADPQSDSSGAPSSGEDRATKSSSVASALVAELDMRHGFAKLIDGRGMDRKLLPRIDDCVAGADSNFGDHRRLKDGDIDNA